MGRCGFEKYFLVLTPRTRSQWYITFQPTSHLDSKHTVFGKLVGGEEVLDTLEKLPRKEGTERPAKPVRITEVVMYVRPILHPVLSNNHDPAIKTHSRPTKRASPKNSRDGQRRMRDQRLPRKHRVTVSIGLGSRWAQAMKPQVARPAQVSGNTLAIREHLT